MQIPLSPPLSKWEDKLLIKVNIRQHPRSIPHFEKGGQGGFLRAFRGEL
jgi:hypothetical protein